MSLHPTHRQSALSFRVILFLMILGEVILINLALWQVRRLGEKQEILAAIDEAEVAPLLDLTADGALSADLWEGELFRQVKIAGRWLKSKPVRANFIIDRNSPDAGQQGTGYRLLAPLQTSGGVLIVDLGYKVDDHLPSTLTASEKVILEGRIWPNEEKSWFSLSDSELNRLLFTISADTVAEWTGYKTSFPGLLRLTRWAESVEELGELKIPGLDISRPPNNHLEYAITWSLLALCWGGLTLYWLFRRRVGAA